MQIDWATNSRERKKTKYIFGFYLINANSSASLASSIECIRYDLYTRSSILNWFAFDLLTFRFRFSLLLSLSRSASLSFQSTTNAMLRLLGEIYICFVSIDGAQKRGNKTKYLSTNNNLVVSRTHSVSTKVNQSVNVSIHNAQPIGFLRARVCMCLHEISCSKTINKLR